MGLCNICVKLGRGKDAVEHCSSVLKINEENLDALVQVISPVRHVRRRVSIGFLMSSKSPSELQDLDHCAGLFAAWLLISFY